MIFYHLTVIVLILDDKTKPKVILLPKENPEQLCDRASLRDLIIITIMIANFILFRCFKEIFIFLPELTAFS